MDTTDYKFLFVYRALGGRFSKYPISSNRAQGGLFFLTTFYPSSIGGGCKKIFGRFLLVEGAVKVGL